MVISVHYFVVLLCWLLQFSGSKATENCDQTVNCYIPDANCTNNCKWFEYKPSSTPNAVDFTLILTNAVKNKYIAFAFGSDYEMVDSDLYYCFSDEDELKFGTGAIRQQFTTPHQVLLDSNSAASYKLTNISLSLQDGVLKCSFTRSYSVTKEVSDGKQIDFDIENNEYYLLWAEGEVKKDGSLRQHLPKPGRGHTTVKYNLSGVPGTVVPTGTTTVTPKSEVPTVTTEHCAKDGVECYIPDSYCTNNCKWFEWKLSSTPNAVDFTLILTNAVKNDYIAFAFGSDYEMVDSDLYYCFSHRNGLKFGTGAIRQQFTTPHQVLLDSNSAASYKITNVYLSLQDGVLKCSFTRGYSVTKEVSGGKQIDFDIENNEYYLLWAEGRVKKDGSLRQHLPKPGRGHTTVKYNLSGVSDSGTE